jgi:uncharacterized membrane protein YbhN (UPF0104 family)
VSVAAVAGVVWWALHQDSPGLPDSPAQALPLALAVGLYGVATVARGWRWNEILRRLDAGHRTADAYALVTVGYMGNAVLPARGGDILRAVILGPRSNARRREVFGTIIAERLLDAVVLVGLFVVLTIANVGGSPLGRAPALISVAVLVIAGLAISFYLRLRRRGRFERFAAIVRPFARSSKLLFSRLGLVLAGLTVLIWLLEGTILVLIGSSLNLGLNLVDGVFLIVLASFSAMIPAAPGYVGTFDAALIFGLKALDVGSGDAVAFTVLTRFILFVPVTVAGLMLCFFRYGGFRAIREYESAPG